MKKIILPKLKIDSITNDAGKIYVLCQINTIECVGQKWIDDNYIGYLKIGNQLISGRWHFVDDKTWKFDINEKFENLPFSSGDTIECIDGYYGERAEIIFNSNIKWEKQIFDDTNDHDHCAICWTTIYPEKEYMSSGAEDNVCLDCYDNYVRPKSLSFIGEV